MKQTDKDIQMLGPQAVLEGNLVFEGSLFMNGHAKGTIESRSGSIVVGEDAVLHADIFVRSAKINGEIKGKIHATERIEIHPPARVYGDLNAPIVRIDAGVIFEGNCMIKPGAVPASRKERLASTNAEKTEKPMNLSDKSKLQFGTAENKEPMTGAQK